MVLRCNLIVENLVALLAFCCYIFFPCLLVFTFWLSTLQTEEKQPPPPPAHQDSVAPKPSQEPDTNEVSRESSKACLGSGNQCEASGGEASDQTAWNGSQDASVSDCYISSHVESVKKVFVERTEKYGIPELERLYTQIMKGVFKIKGKGGKDDPKDSILKFLLKFAEDESNFWLLLLLLLQMNPWPPPPQKEKKKLEKKKKKKKGFLY